VKWKWLLGALVLPGVLAALLGCYWPFGTRPAGLSLPGVVETQEIRLGSKVAGRVAEVAVSEGGVVEAGQVLVRFDTAELQARREQCQARLQAAQARLDKAQSGPRAEEKAAARAAVEGARARWQRLANGARPEEIAQARSELAALEAEVRHARKRLERAQQLLHEDLTNQAEVDMATAARDRARARSAAARARLELVQAGARPEELAEAAAELQRAEASQQLLQRGTRPEDLAEAAAHLAELRAQLHEIAVHLEEAVVRAPERAVVEVVSVRKGDLVAPNQTVVSVLRTDDLWVKVYVSEVDLPRLSLNQTVQVTIDAYPSWACTGTVEQIAAKCEFLPRNVQSIEERQHQVFGVKVRVANPDGVFKSGMAAEVFLPLGGS
jgi:multidrug resistance efflux pump